MARIRSVKPEFWTDRKIARLSRDARLLYMSMWNLSDEHARLHGDTRYIKGHCLPYDDDLDLDDIDALIEELEAHGRVQRYEEDGDPYLFLPTLAKHQRLESEKQASRLPAPPALSVKKSAPESEPPADLSAESPDSSGEIVAQQVAGSRLQVAGENPRSADAEPAPDFEAFWLAYPRKVGKGAARKSWATAIKRHDPADIVAGAVVLAQQPGREDRFTPHPATWLNAERWLDEQAPALRAVPDEEWRALGRLGSWDV